jgi:hypothetical protein
MYNVEVLLQKVGRTLTCALRVFLEASPSRFFNGGCVRLSSATVKTVRPSCCVAM